MSWTLASHIAAGFLDVGLWVVIVAFAIVSVLLTIDSRRTR